MAEGRRKDEWGRLSCWLAMFGNANRDPKKGKPFTPDSFNPYAEKKKVILSPQESQQRISGLFGVKKKDGSVSGID